MRFESHVRILICSRIFGRNTGGLEYFRKVGILVLKELKEITARYIYKQLLNSASNNESDENISDYLLINTLLYDIILGLFPGHSLVWATDLRTRLLVEFKSFKGGHATYYIFRFTSHDVNNIHKH